MDELVRRSIRSNPTAQWLALKYDELERKKNLFACHADFAEILLLEHECEADRVLLKNGFANGTRCE